MIKRIIKLYLKDNKNQIYIPVLVIVGVLLTILQYRLIGNKDLTNMKMGEIMLQIYGGLTSDHNVAEDAFSVILWLAPNLLVIYLINISIVNRIKESTTIVLSRIKKKGKWFIANTLAIIFKVISFNCILFLTSLVVIWIKSGNLVFKNDISYLNINQYLLLLYIVLLNTITIVAIQIFINNVYYIFYNSNESCIFALLLFIILIFFVQKSWWCKFLIVNIGMIKRHEVFIGGFDGLNIIFSLCVLTSFIAINILLGLFIIKRRDLVTN